MLALWTVCPLIRLTFQYLANIVGWNEVCWGPFKVWHCVLGVRVASWYIQHSWHHCEAITHVHCWWHTTGSCTCMWFKCCILDYMAMAVLFQGDQSIQGHHIYNVVQFSYIAYYCATIIFWKRNVNFYLTATVCQNDCYSHFHTPKMGGITLSYLHTSMLSHCRHPLVV